MEYRPSSLEYNDGAWEMPTHDRLIHLHVTRMGGTAFDRILRRLRKMGLMPVGTVVSKHMRYEQLAQVYVERDLPVPPAVAFIRNPWQWYVAMWIWVQAGGFRGDLKEYVRLVSEGQCQKSLTAYWEWMQADKAQYVCRLENWRNDILALFANVDIIPDLVTEAEAGRIIDEVGQVFQDKVMGKGLMGHHGKYYDQTAMKLVIKMDGDLIRRFDYEF